MNCTKSFWAWKVLLVLVSSPVAAYMPLNTDDAGTTAKGGYQIEQYFY